MNEDLLKQIARQLKFIKFWLTLFGTLILISLIILGFFIFKLISFTNNAARDLNDLQQQAKQSVNLKQNICSDKVSGLLAEAQSNLCDR